MPWTVDDVERHNQGLSDEQKRQWVAVANSARKKCMDEGGESAQCDASAIRQANGVVKSNQMESYRRLAPNYTVREELLQGRTHLVVPVVMMTQGVHAGSHGPILHLSDELGRFPAAWDGIPVCIGHPKDGDFNISANQPRVLDEWMVGRVFNTHMDGQKLRAEAWLDKDLLGSMSPQAMAHISKGLPIDVSVGVFTEDEMSSGDHLGEHYEAVARNHRPDHLALLPGATGACSWADGCGVRANQKELAMSKKNIQVNVGRLKYDGTESTAWNAPSLQDFGMGSDWAGMGQPDRAKIAAHFLIGTGQSESFSDLKLPVVNPKSGKLNEHALRACISGRGAQVSASPREKMAARRMAYGLLNKEFGADLAIPDTLELEGQLTEVLVQELAKEGILLEVNELSHQDISGQIQAKLDRMDDDTKFHFLKDVFNDHFIYRVEPRGNSNQISAGPDGSSNLFKRDYTAAADGTVEFTGEAIPVIKRVSYDPIQRGGVQNMSKPCCKEKVEMLIQTGLYTESDRDRLLAMEEADIDILSASAERAQAQVNEQKTKVETLQANAAAQGQTRDQAIQTLKDDLKDKDKFLALAPPEIQATLKHGLNLYEAEKTRKISHILANTVEGVYTKEGLEAMDSSALDALARAIKAPDDYSGLAPTNPVSQVGPTGYEDNAVYPPEVQG